MTPFTIATSGPLTPMVEFRKVPQLMAEGDDLELVATPLPGTAVAAGRRFSTLALARLGGATTGRAPPRRWIWSCPDPRASRAG